MMPSFLSLNVIWYALPPEAPGKCDAKQADNQLLGDEKSGEPSPPRGMYQKTSKN